MRRPLVLALIAAVAAGCGQSTALTAPPTLPVPAPTSGPSSERTAPPTAAAPTAAPPESNAPAPDGSIVFMREEADGRFHTWTSCVDLTRSKQVPTAPGRDAGWAVWSPDGARIAFNANFDDPDLDDALEIWDIYTMEADGSDVVRLTDSPGLYGDPGYSPDGTLLAFDSTVAGSEGVYVMSALDGSGMRKVTGLPDGVTIAYAPRFSPDGTELVFTGVFDERSGALYVVGIDGSGLRRITPGTLSPDKPAWSAASGLIAFDASSAAFPFQSLWTVRSDGTELTHLMADFVIEPGPRHGFSQPAWSPDGSLLLTTHGLHSDDGAVTLRLSTVRPDGTQLRYVSDAGRPEALKPDWSAAPC